MIISKTPLRISFVGGGTDLPSFYKYNDYGSVLSTTINSYLYVTVKEQNSLFEKYRLNYSETELVNNISEIRNSIIRECIEYMNIKERLYISTIADAPSHTGLGSSSSFTVGLLCALYKFCNKKMNLKTLAKEAAHIEITRLNQSLGKQDHYAAVYGGLNIFKFDKNENVSIQRLNIKKENLNTFYSSILMFWTGMTRSSEKILNNQQQNNKVNNSFLLEMREQVDHLGKLLESKKISLKDIGKLISNGWDFKKRLSPLISNEKIDNVYKEAINSGAYGGKILGAGGGGFLMLIVEPSSKKEILSKIESMGFKYYNFNFNFDGTRVLKIK
jgi:D-glycero-alpha-D-manno-heptose-7-phosphate kinase